MIWVFHPGSGRIPDPDPDFLPIADPGPKGTGSRIRIRNTAGLLRARKMVPDLFCEPELRMQKPDQKSVPVNVDTIVKSEVCSDPAWNPRKIRIAIPVPI